MVVAISSRGRSFAFEVEMREHFAIGQRFQQQFFWEFFFFFFLAEWGGGYRGKQEDCDEETKNSSHGDGGGGGGRLATRLSTGDLSLEPHPPSKPIGVRVGSMWAIVGIQLHARTFGSAFWIYPNLSIWVYPTVENFMKTKLGLLAAF